MERRDKLVAAIAKNLGVKEAQAALAVDAVIAEAVSPVIFRKPGGDEVGFINDNHCTNNCQEPIAVRPELASQPK